MTKFNVWRRLLWDAAAELLTGSRRPICGDRIGPLECERRDRHRGKHAMAGRRTFATWTRHAAA